MIDRLQPINILEKEEECYRYKYLDEWKRM